MPEMCVKCGGSPIHGYTADAEPLCSPCFEKECDKELDSLLDEFYSMDNEESEDDCAD